jgi:hypothetical protein
MSEESSREAGDSSPAKVLQLIFGGMVSQALHVAAKLGIADLVASTPQTIDELAQATKTDAGSLRRLILYLASIGIFAEDAEGKYRQTPMSDTLRSDNPRSFRGLSVLFGSDFMWRSLGELSAAVASGHSGFEQAFGTTYFEYLAKHADAAAIFNAGMTSLSSVDVSEVIRLYDFSKFERLVDVGGGQGALLHGILAANPNLRGVLMDLPSVVEGASVLRTGPVADRCEIVGGDFFQAVPAGGDAYLMRVVIHDWNDADALRILKNCQRAIRPDGKLILIDSVLKPSNQPDPGRFNDLVMLAVAPGGKERTEPEFRKLLSEAGFVLNRIIPGSGLTAIIESLPA